MESIVTINSMLIDCVVQVKDDAMVRDNGSSGISFLIGNFLGICFDLEPKAGDYVAYFKKGQKEAHFRQLIDDSGSMFLFPLNTRFEKIPLTKDIKILGVVVQQVQFCRS